MKHLLVLILSTALFSCNTIGGKLKEPNVHPTPDLKEKIDEYFSALSSIGKFNGVIYVIQKNTEIINKAYNLNPDKESTTYVSIESQFDIHSVSKLMAHYLIEKLEIEGKLSKGQFLNEFIPGFPNGEKITLEMLLNHTSGLPRSFENIEGNKIDLLADQIIEYAKKQKLLFKPGTGFQYSNVGYELVYFIIERISKKTFAQYVNDELFKPLKMKSSGTHFYTKENNIKCLAKNHKKDDTLIVQVDNILKDELKTARLFSTASDLNKFLNHIKHEPYASLLKDENNVIEKNGGSDGIRVEIYTNLERDYNFILLCNYDEIPFQKTIEDLTKILENKPYEIPKELNRKSIKLPSDKMEKYIGTYSFADLNNLDLTFSINENHLVVYQDKELIAILNAESEYIFFEDPKEPESFEFINNEKGSFDVLMGWKGIKLKGIRK
ncbi:MAG TPA: hypothetical protein DIW31_02390 [Bacteroidales bacterium]|nr:hypothetical protein [Bacteroidales bacterium]